MFKTTISIRIFLFAILLSTITTCKKKDDPDPSGDNNTFIVDVNGGEFLLNQGIRVIVPANALNTPTTITISNLDYNSYSNQYEDPIEVAEFLNSFKGEPNGLIFNKPVKFIFPEVSIPSGSIPILKTFDEEDNYFVLPKSELTYDPVSRNLEITIYHFSTKLTQAVDQYKSEECTSNPCRCGKIKVVQNDDYQICDNGSCQVIESTVSVTFVDCDNKTEESVFREVTPGCRPQMTLTPEKSTVYKSESTQVEALVQLSCVPIEEQSVDFVHDLLGVVNPDYSVTDEEGKARTSFTAGNSIGFSTVTANTTVSYYAYSITAEGETYNGPLKTLTNSATADIEIIDSVEYWQGTLVTTFTGCEPTFCMSNYSFNFNINFELHATDWEAGYNFTAPGSWTLTRGGDISTVVEEQTIQNIRGITSDTLFMFLDKQTRKIQLFFPSPSDEEEDPFFFQFEFWQEGFLVGSLYFAGLSKSQTELYLETDLTEDIVNTTGECYLWNTIGMYGTYQLNLTKQ